MLIDPTSLNISKQELQEAHHQAMKRGEAPLIKVGSFSPTSCNFITEPRPASQLISEYFDRLMNDS